MTHLTKKEALRRLNLAGEFINQGYSLSMAIDSAGLNPLRAKAFCFLNEFKIQQPAMPIAKRTMLKMRLIYCSLHVSQKMTSILAL